MGLRREPMSLIFLATVLLLTCAGPSFSQSVLNFPRVISNSTIYSGIAVTNPNPDAADVTFIEQSRHQAFQVHDERGG